MTTDLPQKPGLYLFVGERKSDPKSLTMPTPELVRVFWQGGKPGSQLLYVGRDFFYHLDKVVGVWREISCDDMLQEAWKMKRLLFLKDLLEEFHSRSWGDKDRAAFDRFLATSSWQPAVRDDEKRADLVDFAWKENLLPEDPFTPS